MASRAGEDRSMKENRPQVPDQAFILAAGMGSRLRPVTDTCPKPMVSVGGRPIIDRIIDSMKAAGITRFAANTHYLHTMLEDHLSNKKPPVSISYEESLLDTGGGLLHAVNTGLVGPGPFVCASCDILVEDESTGDAIRSMAAAWDDETMDLLLLLQPVEKMGMTHGTGDYHLDAGGRPRLSPDKSGAYFWTSMRIIHPRLFTGETRRVFSFLDLMKRAETEGRLGAVVHDGVCHHISSPADLDAVNTYLAERAGAGRRQNG